MFTKMAILALLAGGPVFGAAIAPGFSASYSLYDLGSAPNVPGPYGGLIISAADTNTLLLGGFANNGAGEIDAVGLLRDAANHIIGFSGTNSVFSAAPNIDGGLVYAPNGDLLFTEFSNNEIGEIKPGSIAPDKTVSSPTQPSVGTLQFIPNGFPGAGSLVIASYTANTFCTSALTPDGTGTYDIAGCANQVSAADGPEGIIYVPNGSPLFASPSVLISEYRAGIVSAYSIDANGLPVSGSQQDFVTGLSGAEGATIDPLTGDFLFSTFGGGNEVFAVRGFTAPVTVPEPTTLSFSVLALMGVCGWRRRSNRARA